MRPERCPPHADSRREADLRNAAGGRGSPPHQRVIVRIRGYADASMTLEFYSNASPSDSRRAARAGEPHRVLLLALPSGMTCGDSGRNCRLYPAASSSERSAMRAVGSPFDEQVKVRICCGTCGVLLRYWQQERPSPTLARASGLRKHGRVTGFEPAASSSRTSRSPNHVGC